MLTSRIKTAGWCNSSHAMLARLFSPPDSPRLEMFPIPAIRCHQSFQSGFPLMNYKDGSVTVTLFVETDRKVDWFLPRNFLKSTRHTVWISNFPWNWFAYFEKRIDFKNLSCRKNVFVKTWLITKLLRIKFSTKHIVVSLWRLPEKSTEMYR